MLTMNALGTEANTIMRSQPHLLTPPGEAGRPGGLPGRPWDVLHPQVQALSARWRLHSSAALASRSDLPTWPRSQAGTQQPSLI